MKVRIKADKGKLIQGRDNLAAMIHALDGEYIIEAVSLKEPHTIEEWRHLYFYLRDLLHQSVETGYTKKELHEVIKIKILGEMWEVVDKEGDFAGWFTDFTPNTTNVLNPFGWREFVKRFKEFAMDNFETYI